jgi:hypothetical protein
LHEALGWEARVRFEEGMAETVAWYQTHDEWLAQTLAGQDSFLGDALALAETAGGSAGRSANGSAGGKR